MRLWRPRHPGLRAWPLGDNLGVLLAPDSLFLPPNFLVQTVGKDTPGTPFTTKGNPKPPSPGQMQAWLITRSADGTGEGDHKSTLGWLRAPCHQNTTAVSQRVLLRARPRIEDIQYGMQQAPGTPLATRPSKRNPSTR